MVGAIIVLSIELVLTGCAALVYFFPFVGWILAGVYLVLALIAGLMLPKSIKGIKTRTPSRGKAIATTAIAGTAVMLGVIYALTVGILGVAFLEFLPLLM